MCYRDPLVCFLNRVIFLSGSAHDLFMLWLCTLLTKKILPLKTFKAKPPKTPPPIIPTTGFFKGIDKTRERRDLGDV